MMVFSKFTKRLQQSSGQRGVIAGQGPAMHEICQRENVALLTPSVKQRQADLLDERRSLTIHIELWSLIGRTSLGMPLVANWRNHMKSVGFRGHIR